MNTKQQEAFLTHLVDHRPEKAAQSIGVPVMALYRFRQRDADFGARWKAIQRAKSYLWIEDFFRFFAELGSAPKAAEAAGVTRQRVYQVYKKDATFRKRWHRIQPISKQSSQSRQSKMSHP